MAVSLFLCWLRSCWQETTIPVGMGVSRTADEAWLTCCPPAPRARMDGEQGGRPVLRTLEHGLELVSAKVGLDGPELPLQLRRHDLVRLGFDELTEPAGVLQSPGDLVGGGHPALEGLHLLHQLA